MSYEQLETLATKATEFFSQRGIKGSIVFHGTEPFLMKEPLFRLIESHYKEINFGLQTNGLLVTDDDISFIKEKKLNLGISLDSPNRQINDRLRGEGHYDKVVHLLQQFDGYRGLNVVTTITKHNVDQLSDMVRFLGDHKVSLCLMNPVRGTQQEALAFRPEVDTLGREFIKAVDTAIQMTKEGQRIVIADFANMLLGFIAPTSRILQCDISPCGGGRRFLSIAADGTAYPCGEFIGSSFDGGNIFSSNFTEILNSENFIRIRQRTVEAIPDCKECIFRNVCGCPCPAELISETGSLYARSYYCEFYKRMAEHCLRIIHRDKVDLVIRRSAMTEQYSLSIGS